MIDLGTFPKLKYDFQAISRQFGVVEYFRGDIGIYYFMNCFSHFSGTYTCSHSSIVMICCLSQFCTLPLSRVTGWWSKGSEMKCKLNIFRF